MAPHLAAIQPPLGPQVANPKLYSPHQVTLALKEKVFSLSGDDFTVKTAEGVSICKCKGKVLSVRDKKKFTDMQDNELFHLTNKLLTIHKSFHAESKDGNADFEIKGHFKLIGTKSTVVFRNAADGSNVELDVKGNWLNRDAEITWGGRPVAKVSRSFFNVREFFGDDTYFVAVAANVDLAMVAAICISLDEKEEGK